MKRRNFIKNSCMLCLGIGAASSLLNSCKMPHYANGKIEGTKLFVALDEFYDVSKDGKKVERKYILAKHDSLHFPICIYRISENKFNALWMQCSHQGAELQVFGDTLQCPAHGSEFNQNGVALSGPANKNLRAFETTVEKNNLIIHLV